MTHTITVVGLGNYNIDDLPLGVYRFLENKTKIYARTLDHPVIEELKETLQFESFDHIYMIETFELKRFFKLFYDRMI